MVHPDYPRFKKIAKNLVRKNLRLFINYGDLTGRKGKQVIKIPIRNIEIPRFKYSDGKEGIGQGDGEGNQPGQDPGEHFFEVDVSLDELVEIIVEEMELPNIEPKGKGQITQEKYKYTNISKTGPDSLRSFKRTFREALKRQLVSGEYNPDDPLIYPVKQDTRYKARKSFEAPEINAVLFYLLDVSGSMYHNMDIARRMARLMELLLKHTHKNLKLEYITHDVEANRVYTENDFYTINASGGTSFASAYNLCSDIIKKEYTPAEWNIYVAQFSDGEPFDFAESFSALSKKILPVSNGFFYSQISPSKANFYDILDRKFGNAHPALRMAWLSDTGEVYDAIKKLFKKNISSKK